MDRPAPSRRDTYNHFTMVTTRWMDNDVFGHLNNAVYYSLFDTAVTTTLMQAGVLDWKGGAQFMVVAESGCRYHRSVAFPDPLTIGLRIEAIGRSSIRYGLAVFDAGDTAAADGFFVHICVDSATRRPAPLPPDWRALLTALG